MVRPALPASLKDALLRGIRFKCPRCEGAGLFGRYLKPTAQCASCGQDWTHHQADDFPPYVAIFVTGHVLTPVIIWLSLADSLPMWARLAITVTIACSMVLALLQPAKGGVIALQWWMGMHGFAPGGREEVARIKETLTQG